MQPIQWTPEFAIGIDEIDDQHKQLVDMINALEISKDGDQQEATRKLLWQLNDYVRDHFSLEERLMLAGGCERDFITRHCGEHAYFRGALKAFTREFEISRREVNASQIEYLVHWLLHHIVCVDREMVKQLHTAAPPLETEVAVLAQHFTEDLTEAERHLITDLQHSNVDLIRQLEQLRGVAADADKIAPDVLVLLSASDEALARRLAEGIQTQHGLRAEVLAGANDARQVEQYLAQLAAAGVGKVKLVPLNEQPFLATHLNHWRASFPALELTLGAALTQCDEVLRAMAFAALKPD